jgi:hypothetical protein
VRSDVTEYLTAFGITLAVEVPLYTAALHGAWHLPWRRAVLAATSVNVATHPALWWALHPVTARPAYPWMMVAAELAVCAAEALLLMAWLRRRDPLLAVLAVAVNATSVLAGLIAANVG